MSRPMCFWLALALSGFTVAFAVRVNTFTAWGTDAAAYIEEAHRWEAGELFAPLPLQLWAPPIGNDWSVAPFGFRPGVERGTEVGQYPLGLPVLMAAAIRIGGPFAAYLIVPLTAGVLVWCAYLLTSYLAGEWAGLLAASIVAASPIALIFAVQPMSDVPAAAFWALAWAMSVRPGKGAASAAGAAAAMAIMIRPNLAPLAVVIAALLFVRGRTGSAIQERSWGPGTVFVSVAAIGPLVVGWSHDAMYGSPLRSGYLAQDYLFSLSHIPGSLALYPRLLMRAHTPLIFAGLLAATFLLSRQLRARQEARVRHVALSALGIVGVNYLVYLPYVPLSDPGVVRFVLPAFTALVVLFAGLLVRVSRALIPNPAGRLAACVLPVAIVVGYAAEFMPHAMFLRKEQAHLRIAGHYLRDALPANAAIITRLQGAALAHYTNRLIVRFDALHPTVLEAAVADLGRRGYHPIFVLADETEANWVRAHFASSPLAKLDWPPRMLALGVMRYWDPADRESYARGIRWPTDTLSLPR